MDDVGVLSRCSASQHLHGRSLDPGALGRTSSLGGIHRHAAPSKVRLGAPKGSFCRAQERTVDPACGGPGQAAGVLDPQPAIPLLKGPHDGAWLNYRDDGRRTTGRSA
jgi:hypothetical protein